MGVDVPVGTANVTFLEPLPVTPVENKPVLLPPILDFVITIITVGCIIEKIKDVSVSSNKS